MLRPYVCDLHAQWLAERPGEQHRELQATLVFADISGFTPLTERLAKRGRVGAEALTDILNDVFGVLLTVAAGYGGDLVKFGGDALLLLFDGAGHERRACAAAASMQDALARWRRFPTVAGTMSLRMSVGIAAGTLHAFLLGDLHRELLLGGPVVSRVVALESNAQAGQVLVDAAVAMTLDDREFRAADTIGFLLRRPPIVELVGGRDTTADARDAPVASSAIVDAVPAAVRAHLSRRADQGEHRQAVLSFLQFKGLDDLLSAGGPRAAREALDALMCRVQHACDQHGVCFLATDLDRDGGKVLLVAGAPTASPDDVDRTLVTLLDVLAAPSPLTLRAGVNAGPAFAVDVGSPLRRTYAVMGDATNLAARVMGKAAPGQVVATQAALQRARATFEAEPLEPFAVKGKSQPVTASVVRAAGRDVAPAVRTRIVGRARERAELERFVAEARAGRGGVCCLVGDAGMGKSTLVAHFCAVAAGLPQLVVAAAPYAAASPYYAVRRPLRRLLGVADDVDADGLVSALHAADPEVVEWAPLIGVVLGVHVAETVRTRALAAEFRRARAHSAIAALLHTQLRGPAALVVEDAHWLDDASAALVAELATDAAEQQWAMLMTRRPAGGVPFAVEGGRELVLDALSSEEAESLAAGTLRDVPVHLRRELAGRSGGNPLFLLGLLEAARLGASPETLPDTLEALVAARIDALEPHERSLVRQASVFGHRFTASLLAALSGVDEYDVHETMSRLGAIVVPEDGAYRFAHALLRDAAYAALPYRQRRALHARAGELIEQRTRADVEEWADLLSLHFEQSGDHAKTWHYARIAAARARALWAPADACTLYRRALDAAPGSNVSDGELVSTYEELADCAELAGRYPEAAAAYREARRRAGRDVLRAADLCRKEGWVRERSGSYAAAVRWYRRGARTLDAAQGDGRPRGTRDVRTRTQLTLAEGAARLRQGRHRAALPLLHRAVEGAEGLSDEATLAHAYYLLDWAYTDLGMDDALRYRTLSLPIFERLGNLARQGVVLSNLGIDAYFEGRWTEAVDLYERGRVASSKAGDVVQAATAANNIGEVYSDQGRLADAELMFRDALATWRRAPFPVGVSLATSNLGRVAARAGRFDDAAALLADAREGFRVIGADGYVVETQARQAEQLLLAGDAPAAETLAAEAAERATRIGGLVHVTAMLLRLRGCAAAELGDRGRAAQLLRDALAAAERSANPYERALVLRALGRIVGTDEAARCRATADELCTQLDVIWTPELPRVAPATDTTATGFPGDRVMHP